MYKSCVRLYWQYGTRVVGVSQTLRSRTSNGITELSQRAPSIFGWAATTLGIGPHSSLNVFTSLVCPSVGPMSIIQADIVPKWLKVGSYKQYHTRDSGFLKPRISRIFEGITQSGGAKCRCMGGRLKSAISDHCLALSQCSNLQLKAIRTRMRSVEYISSESVTLSDHKYPKPPKCLHFASLFISS